MTDHPGEGRKPRYKMPVWLIWAIRLCIAAAIIFGAVMGYRRLILTAPKRDRKPATERAVVVTAQPVRRSDQAITLKATGTVVAARELSLRPRIGGEIIGVHPDLEPGAIIAAGETAVTLDMTDYDLVVKQAERGVAQAKVQLKQAQVRRLQADGQLVQAKSQLVQAQYNHTLELGKQDVARHEWDMLDGKETATELDRTLTLRKPHLEKALADVEAAEAAVAISAADIDGADAGLETARTAVSTAEATLEQAQLNVMRCAVKVPFNAVVLERGISVGAQVTPQTELAVLVSADVFWVEVALPMDRLPWVALPTADTPGAAVVIRPSGAIADDAAWQGRVIRCLPSLQANGRRARILVEVPNPLTAAKIPLLLGSFVNAEIEGPTLHDVYEIPRESIHNGSDVWLRGADGRLDVVATRSLWGDEARVLVSSGLEEGQMLITSDLASPVPGMLVMLPDEAAAAQDATAREASPAMGAQTGGARVQGKGRME